MFLPSGLCISQYFKINIKYYKYNNTYFTFKLHNILFSYLYSSYNNCIIVIIIITYMQERSN